LHCSCNARTLDSNNSWLRGFNFNPDPDLDLGPLSTRLARVIVRFLLSAIAASRPVLHFELDPVLEGFDVIRYETQDPDE
jgi:hypothetical protein